MFGSFDILAGDFKKGGSAQFVNSTFVLSVPGKLFREDIKVSEVETIEVATEDNLKKMGGAIGWGIVGGLALGGIGAIAGLLAGGKKKEVTFICKFKDGRKLLAKADGKIFEQIQAACF
jgi:hypothetical protein